MSISAELAAKRPMDDAEKERRVRSDPDFILLKRFGHSLKALLTRYPDGVPTNVIAQALGITEDEVDRSYDRIVVALRAVVCPER